MENQNTPNEGEEKKFTQADIDAIISKRLAEERKKYPSAEELAGYEAYKASRQTDAEKLNNMTAERDAANNKLTAAQEEVARLQHERFLLGKGVTEEDLEYADFKIRKAVTDSKTYEQAADEFLKGFQPKGATRVDFGGNLGGGNAKQTASQQFNALIRAAARKN